MRPPLTVAVAQPLTISYDVAANAQAHAKLIHVASARLVIFPELSLTGYELDATPLSPDDPRLGPLIQACGETGTLALAGAPVIDEGGALHIGMLAIDGAGARIAYRKMYLGGEEPQRFAPGPAPAVIEVDGWRIGLAICKDTGIRQHAEATAALGIDLYAAGVLETAEDAHIQDERAQRIASTYGVWVAVASFAGSTGGGFHHAAGGSAIWSPRREVIARADPAPAAFARATLGNT